MGSKFLLLSVYSAAGRVYHRNRLSFNPKSTGINPTWGVGVNLTSSCSFSAFSSRQSAPQKCISQLTLILTGKMSPESYWRGGGVNLTRYQKWSDSSFYLYLNPLRTTLFSVPQGPGGGWIPTPLRFFWKLVGYPICTYATVKFF